MDTNKKYSDINSSSFFSKVEIPFDKSKEDIWDNISRKMDNPVQEAYSTKILSLSTVKLLVAAMLVVLIGTTFFLRWYSIDIDSNRGEHLSHILPDGSIVDLNAESSISYYPYWWKFKRELTFKGEAFFNVEKGKRFTIISAHGITEVLGTSFNVFARNAKYEVFCETGKVKVSSTKSNIELIISPGEMAIINNTLKQGEITSIKGDQILGWKNNTFSFTSKPLYFVINELERQYNVNIYLQNNIPNNLSYTGYFAKGESVESSLILICKSFNLNYIKNKSGEYTIIEK